MTTMKRANTTQVDAELTAAANRRAIICQALADATADQADITMLMTRLIAETERINHLQFQRSEIIRRTFYR